MENTEPQITELIEPTEPEPTNQPKKKTIYSQSHRLAQQRYRERNREKYCEQQRKLYERLKQNDEWRERHNKKSREANEKYRIKKRTDMINKALENGEDIDKFFNEKRGRPRKI